MNVTSHSATGRTVDLRITDSDGASHQVTIARDGTVEEHWCDACPADEAARSPQERERLVQVERFARYFVARTTAYETLAPYSRDARIADPDRLAAVTLLVGIMAQDTLETRFGDCYQQLASMHTDAEPPVDPPATAPTADCQLIEQDVYLDVDDATVRRLADVLIELEALGGLRQGLDVRPDRGDSDLFARLDSALSPAGTDTDGDVTSDRFVRAVSPLRVHWQADGPTRVEYGDEPEPDIEAPIAARIQLTPAHAPVNSVAAFQRTLVDHLRCQLRDCYVGMGLAPPSDVRVGGPGISAFTDHYEQHDWVQNYHRGEAIIDWTQLAPRPDI